MTHVMLVWVQAAGLFVGQWHCAQYSLAAPVCWGLKRECQEVFSAGSSA